jgi:hypothetical protein
MKSRTVFVLVIVVLALVAVWLSASGGGILSRLGPAIHGAPSH